MDSKKVGLLLSVILLIALSFGYYTISKNEKAEAEIAASASPSPTLDKYIISDSQGVVKTMTYETSAGKTTFVTEDNATWHIEGKETIPLDNEKIKNMTYTFISFTYAQKVFDEVPNLSDYGLDTPSVTITGAMADGKVNTVLVGNETNDKNGYYIMANDDPALYMVEKSQMPEIAYTLNDIIDKTVPVIDSTDLQYVNIKVKGQPEIIMEAAVIPPENAEMYAQYGVSILNMVSPIPNSEVYVDALLTGYLDPVLAISMGELVDPTPTDLSIYGLDQPEIEVIVKDSISTFDFLVGSEVPENPDLVYVKLADKDAVYKLYKSSFENLYDINIFDFADSFVALEGIKYVSAITITGFGESHYITIGQEITPPTEEGKEETITYLPVVDGQEMQEEAFQTFYTNLIGITYDDIVLTEETQYIDVASGPVITFVYEHIDGSPNTQIDFYNYTDNFYAVKSKDGTSWYAVNKQQVDFIFENLQSLLNGELNEE